MVDSYKKLDVWSDGMKLVKSIYQATNLYPKHEQYRLVDQMCRAAISVPANIAEGSARKSTKDFMRFIAISLGSLAELRTYIILSHELGYIDINSRSVLEEQCDFIGKKTQALYNSMQKKATHA